MISALRKTAEAMCECLSLMAEFPTRKPLFHLIALSSCWGALYLPSSTELGEPQRSNPKTVTPYPKAIRGKLWLWRRIGWGS